MSSFPRSWIAQRRNHSGQYFPLLMERHQSHCHWCGSLVVRRRTIGRHSFIKQTNDGWVVYRQRGQERRTRLATIDHVIPLWRGGSAELHNLVLACWSCNTHRNHQDQLRQQEPAEVRLIALLTEPIDWEREVFWQLREIAQYCAHQMNHMNQVLGPREGWCLLALEIYDACEVIRAEFQLTKQCYREEKVL